jgi:hypothetical protein
MKKNIFYAVGIMLATLISCGDNDSKNPQQNEVDINKVLNNLVEDNVITEEAKKSILTEYNNIKDSTKRANANNKGDIDITKATKVNSFDMFEEIYKDRSLYLSKYVDQDIVLTDLLVKNVKTIDVDGRFVKCVIAIPCNTAKERVGVNFNSDNMETPNVYYKTQILYPFYDLVGAEPIVIELKNADDFKKLKMLEWENNADDNFDENTYLRKISIACQIGSGDVSYDAGNNATDDMKAKHIKVTIRNAVIIK